MNRSQIFFLLLYLSISHGPKPYLQGQLSNSYLNPEAIGPGTNSAEQTSSQRLIRGLTTERREGIASLPNTCLDGFKHFLQGCIISGVVQVQVVQRSPRGSQRTKTQKLVPNVACIQGIIEPRELWQVKSDKIVS